MDRLLSLIHEKAKMKVLFTRHALNQMNQPDRMITKDEIYEVIYDGKMVADYPDDPRGRSCLIEKEVGGRIIHVVCAPKDEYLAIVTTYIFTKKEKKG